MSKTVTTRIGISPFATEQHIGVYRSFLTNVFVSHYFNGKTFLRIDDTNPKHQANTNALIDDLAQIIEPSLFSFLPDNETGSTYVGKSAIPAIFESQRSSLYQKYLNDLQTKGFLFDKDGATYFDTQRYIDSYGDRISIPYQGKPNRTGSITKSLPQLYFPIAVDKGQRFLWHFTSVVDDYALGITHVIRAKDKIDNQIPQTILNTTLGFPLPQYLYTKIMLNDQALPKTTDLTKLGISLTTIRSYLYGTITGKPERIYLSFEEALSDFSPKSVTPGQFSFDLQKVLSIQKHLFQSQKPSRSN